MPGVPECIAGGCEGSVCGFCVPGFETVPDWDCGGTYGGVAPGCCGFWLVAPGDCGICDGCWAEPWYANAPSATSMQKIIEAVKLFMTCTLPSGSPAGLSCDARFRRREGTES